MWKLPKWFCLNLHQPVRLRLLHAAYRITASFHSCLPLSCLPRECPRPALTLPQNTSFPLPPHPSHFPQTPVLAKIGQNNLPGCAPQSSREAGTIPCAGLHSHLGVTEVLYSMFVTPWSAQVTGASLNGVPRLHSKSLEEYLRSPSSLCSVGAEKHAGHVLTCPTLQDLSEDAYLNLSPWANLVRPLDGLSWIFFPDSHRTDPPTRSSRIHPIWKKCSYFFTFRFSFHSTLF